MYKKVFIFLIILFLPFFVLSDVIGDVNGNGKIDSTDYTLVRMYLLKSVVLKSDNIKRADANLDGKINSQDYVLIRKAIISRKPITSSSTSSTTNSTSTPSKVDVSGISVNKATLSMDGGDTYNLSAIISPSNATNKSVTWSSDNNKVAMVDSNGKITANTAGTANITATSNNGKKASCKVTVTLNINYKVVRYKHGDGAATTIWYAIIPSKYKMHYAYAKEQVITSGSAEKATDMAKRVNATLAINSQLLGIPIINGSKVADFANVSGYDFYIEKNSSYRFNDLNSPPWDVIKVYGTKDYSKGISLKNINTGFDYEGDHVNYKGKERWLALFSQVIMNGQMRTNFGPMDSSSAYFKKYYTGVEAKKNERHPRTWIAYDSSGRQFVAVATGRNIPLRNGENLTQSGLTVKEMVQFTREYFTNDIVTLYNIDGGGSSAFVYKGNKLNGDYDIDSSGKRYERWILGIFYW